MPGLDPLLQPITLGLFDGPPGQERLIAGRRISDHRIVFPMPSGPIAGDYEAVRLDRVGRLWSFTVQRFRPKSPPYTGADDERTFKPYAVGYVEIIDQVIVEARIATDNFSELKVGMEMELEIVPFARSNDPSTVLIHAFRPRQSKALQEE